MLLEMFAAMAIALFIVSAGIPLICIVAAMSELPWRSIFSKALLQESIENFKCIWSIKMFISGFILFSVVFILPAHLMHKEIQLSEQGQCTCHCKACKLNSARIKAVEEKLGISSNAEKANGEVK